MAISTCKLWPAERSKIVDILSVLFGLGAWVGINGIYTQLPLMVVTAPEGWQLPSLMVIVVQVSLSKETYYNRVKLGYFFNLVF